LMLLIWALSPVLVRFYHEPRLTNIALLASLTFPICALTVQHEALLRRRMRFLSLGIRDVVSSCLAVPIAIALVFRGVGYWALVALPLMVNCFKLILSWLMVRWIPGLPRRVAGLRSLVGFGSNVAASYFVILVNRSADNILIGHYLGAQSLGMYSRAYNLLMLPIKQLSAPISSVAIPTFSRIQNDPDRFARYYLRVANLIMWINGAVFGFLFVAASPVITLVLGNQWHEAAPVFQILAVSGLGQMFLESTIWVLVGRGLSNRLLRCQLIISPIIIVSYAIGLPFGIRGVALAGSLVLLGVLPWVLSFVFRGTRLNLWLLGQAIVWPLSVCVGAVLFGELALHLITSRGVVPQLLVVALSFAIAYSLSAVIRPVREEIVSLRELFRSVA
jgi:O-antigen/teichoic acid export membrane protein